MEKNRKIFKLISLLLLVIILLAVIFSIKFLKEEFSIATNPSKTLQKTNPGALNSSYNKILPRFQ